MIKSISQTFREAVEHLWDGTRCFRQRGVVSYCCFAIRRVIDGDRNACLKIISKRLGKHVSVSSWLSSHNFRGSTEEIQAYRKRWLLALADEFEGANHE